MRVLLLSNVNRVTMERMAASYDATLPNVRTALTPSLHTLLTDRSARMLEGTILNWLQTSSHEYASDPATCPVLQRGRQMMQKLMELDQDQVVEFSGVALPNFPPQSLKLEISFVHLMIPWGDVNIEDLELFSPMARMPVRTWARATSSLRYSSTSKPMR